MTLKVTVTTMTKASDPLMQKYYDYLDELRESGETNMFGAAPFLQDAFPELSKHEAKGILLSWMKEFESIESEGA